MRGPEEWRPRRRVARRSAAQNPAYRLASHFSPTRARRTVATLDRFDESRRPHPLARAAVGAGGAAGLPGHARAVLDRHLPAGVHRHRAGIGATPVEMQQTLSAYLFGFAVMNLFHGALSDSFGRRPVVLRRPGRLHAGLGRLRAVAAHRRAGLLPRDAGHVGRRRHRDLARRHPRHVPAGRCAAGDVAGDDLLRRRAGGGADGRRLPVRARRLACDLLVPDRARRRPLDRQLQAAAGDAAPQPQASRSTRATCCAATGGSAATRASWRSRWPAASRSTACSCTCCRRRCSSASTCSLGAGAVLLVLHADDRRHHGRRLPVGPDGRTHQAAAPDPPRLRDHAGGVGGQPGAEPAVRAAGLVGAVPAARSIRSAGR